MNTLRFRDGSVSIRSGPKTGLDSYDTDYSINLLLAPAVEGETQTAVEAGFQGWLIRKNEKILDDGLTYLERTGDNDVKFTGEFSKSPQNGKHTSVLHSEFEGDGVYLLCFFAKVALGLANLVAAASVFPPLSCRFPK